MPKKLRVTELMMTKTDIDDMHGWNFLGDSTKENLEYERIIKDKSLVDEKTYQARL
jgi:hypothetical protein